jgi:hypothetical protein
LRVCVQSRALSAVGITELNTPALPQDDSHAARLAHFAVAAQSAARETLVDNESPDKGCVVIRVGISSGPVSNSCHVVFHGFTLKHYP